MGLENESDSGFIPGAFLGVYGPSGTGKTGMAGGYIRAVSERYGKPVLYGDTEDGSGAIKSSDIERERYKIFRFGVKWSKKKGIYIPSDPIDDAIEFTELVKSGEFGGSVMDTVSTMTFKIFRAQVAKNLSDGRATGRVRINTGKNVINHPSQQDYGMFASIIDDWYSRLVPGVEMGCSCLLTGHDRTIEREDDDGDIVDSVGTIDAPGKIVPKSFPKTMQLCVRLIRKSVKNKENKKANREVRRIIMTEGDDTWIAKDRLNVFESREDITVEKVEDKQEFQNNIYRMAEDFWNMWFNEWDGRFRDGKKKKKSR